jgi:hypothetical protein
VTLQDLRELVSMLDVAYKPAAYWLLNRELSKSVSQREGITEKRWKGRARYMQRYARGPR